MFADYSHSYTFENQRPRFWQSPKILALPLGLAFGFLFASILPTFAGLFFFAPWLLGLAIGCVGVALISARRTGETLWGMAILGQVLGVVAISLLFLGLIA